MSRNIDFSKPLSEDEQSYVADRPWLLIDARLRGEDAIVDEDFSVDEAEDETEDETEEVEAEDAEAEDEDAEEAPYVEWGFAELKAEAKNRDLSQAGSKEQLIKRLEQDDASDAE